MMKQVLLSGDYWHEDFKHVLSSFEVPVTMVPIEKLDRLEPSNIQFDLIIIAESRRGTVEESLIESLRSVYSHTPIVSLLGSWSEGETRSGEPIPGTIRVYWHQWKGQFDQFISQLDSEKLTDWHQPPTTTTSDKIETAKIPDLSQGLIGVSAWTQTQYEMFSEGLKVLGYQTKWLERSTWDGQSIRLLNAICVDANSISNELTSRIQWLKSTFGGAPMVLVLNFPRTDEVDTAENLGVAEIISKPFELADVMTAILRATNQQEASNRTVVQ